MRSTTRLYSRLLLALIAAAPLLPQRLCADFSDNVLKYNKGYFHLAAAQIAFAKNDDEVEVFGSQETLTSNGSTVQACTVSLPLTPNTTTPALTKLPGVGSGECQAQCANADGMVAGACYSGGDYVACTWTPPSNFPNIEHLAASTTWKIATLAKLAGSVSSEALGINDSGVVVGLSTNSTFTQHAVRWSSSGAVTDLNDADGNFSLPLTRAAAINNFGQIVGTASFTHPFLLANGVTTDLGNLGGFFGNANAINNSGDVVGQSETAGNEDHAFLYNGTMTDLGTLPGGNVSNALAINDSGIVVGFSILGNGTQHAVLWASNGTIYDINAIAPNTTYVYTSATAIDSNGDIFVTAENKAQDQYGILLTVPPSGPSGSAPIIQSNPGNLTEAVGATKVTFTGSATGSPTPTYQWYFGTKKITDATSSSYTIAKVAAANAGNYSFVATNSHGSATSKSATLTVVTPPTITGQLKPQTAVSGGNATFSLTATGTPTLNFYWQFSKTTASYSNVTMTTVSSLTLTGVTSANQGNYRVIVSNAAGATKPSSSAKLTVKPPKP